MQEHSHSSRKATVRCSSRVASVQGTWRSWNMVAMALTLGAQAAQQKLGARDGCRTRAGANDTHKARAVQTQTAPPGPASCILSFLLPPAPPANPLRPRGLALPAPSVPACLGFSLGTKQLRLACLLLALPSPCCPPASASARKPPTTQFLDVAANTPHARTSRALSAASRRQSCRSHGAEQYERWHEHCPCLC